jgi:uncharacterized peroxidase-related enzyme
MFLKEAPETEAVRNLYEEEREQLGYVMNLTRVWAWNPEALRAFVAFRGEVVTGSGLTRREQAVLVCSTAAAMGDSYCALAWGANLSTLVGPECAAAVIKGHVHPELDGRERALMRWAQSVVIAPTRTRGVDVMALREAGLGEREIFSATAFVAARLAFSIINDALGARPDREVFERAPLEVRNAVDFGRLPEDKKVAAAA